MSSEESDILVSPTTTGYSADVKMDLYFNGRRFPIAQMGGDTIFLRDPFGESPGEGEVTLTIDGHPRRWLVTIPPQPLPSRNLTAHFRDPD